MIKVLIQIENGPAEDSCAKWGFISMDADERTSPDEKEDAVSSYAEEAGEHRDGRTVDAPFDYTAKFLVEAPGKSLTDVNTKINAFNRAIRETVSGSDVKRKKEITLYHLNNGVKIVGTPDLIALPEEVYHSNRHGGLDFAVFDLKIRVSDPSKCDFELKTQDDDPQDGSVRISLAADGADVVVSLSKPLAGDEHVTLLRRGAAYKPIARMKDSDSRAASYTDRSRVMRKNRWQVYTCYTSSPQKLWWPFVLDDKGRLKFRDIIDGAVTIRQTPYWEITARGSHQGIRKSSGSRRYSNLGKGVTFGVAVYRTTNSTGSRYVRISNVAYFKCFFRDGMTVVST